LGVGPGSCRPRAGAASEGLSATAPLWITAGGRVTMAVPPSPDDGSLRARRSLQGTTHTGCTPWRRGSWVRPSNGPGTRTPSRSCGPRTPTRSSASSSVETLQQRTTSASLPLDKPMNPVVHRETGADRDRSQRNTTGALDSTVPLLRPQGRPTGPLRGAPATRRIRRRHRSSHHGTSPRCLVNLAALMESWLRR
jgi:hypothetical protein